MKFLLSGTFILFLFHCFFNVKSFSTFKSLLPVFHNVEEEHISAIAEIIQDRSLCSISLRHENALNSFGLLEKAMSKSVISKCNLGVSTVVSENQIENANKKGANFISTMYYSSKIIEKAKNHNVSCLCGVSTKNEFMKATKTQVSAIKFYPKQSIKPNELKSLLFENQNLIFQKSENLFHNSANNNINYRNGGEFKKPTVSVFISGGVIESDFKPFLLAGASNFALGFDVKYSTISEIIKKLNYYDKYFEEIYNDVYKNPALNPI